jgi:multicopper oxidase
MKRQIHFLILSLTAFTIAAPSFGELVERQSSPTSSSAAASGTPCAGNTASDRSTWCQYSTSTDYYNEIPDTGVTREYWFSLEQVNLAPDGVSRMALTVNGTMPGPTIIADWGDIVIIHVTNNLDESHNGSSIHFHGLRQNYTNQNDGVVSVTQCPSPPGNTYTYRWRASQYGSTWWHSHFALSAWEGIFGGIRINGPATANYDVDLGNLFLQDWSHQTADELYDLAQLNGVVQLDTGLINGTNVYVNGSTQTGSYYSTTFTSGQSYLIRLVNPSIDTHFKFMIDNHTMTVIANDLVPIQPYNTTILSIGMGQRYDIVVTADQASVASDFWMRAYPQVACSSNGNVDGIKGIVHYGDSTGTPTTTGYTYTDECVDEPYASLVPFVAKNVGAEFYDEEEVLTLTKNNESYFRWLLNNTSLQIQWDDPVSSSRKRRSHTSLTVF